MRKSKPVPRVLLPDPIYQSILVAKLINQLMMCGKKGLAQHLVYSAFDKIQIITSTNPLEIFNVAMDNLQPYVELKGRKVGGANYQVPIAVTDVRKITLSLRWLITYARKRKEKTFIESLTKEIIDASNKLGGAFKKREEIIKMAESNKVFSHFSG